MPPGGGASCHTTNRESEHDVNRSTTASWVKLMAGTAAKKSEASSIGISSTSAMVRPLKCTSRVSRL